MSNLNETEPIEMKLLLEGIFEKYGYDFRDYAQASLKRRVAKCLNAERLKTISGLQEKILHDPAAMGRFLNILSIDVSALFRDPGFYLAIRKKVVPFLRTYPSLRIWHAGCASGEEVYSLAILLKEEGLLEKTRIYATDMNETLINKAREGIFALKEMKDNTKNYQAAGGKKNLSDYYKAKYDHALFTTDLTKKVTFAVHNLVTDSSFNEFNVILCRNVMIYFNRDLQDRVHHLLYESLSYYGILCLGAKESLKFTPHEGDYEEVDGREKIFRKIK
ncbi:MAG: protein-glutamate O-methyltransferase CheR [Deltaproteobacteria bacterium]|nr:protein-glutamate O-methyltransferase CheR [Deltaproteobacteria bacterium]